MAEKSASDEDFSRLRQCLVAVAVSLLPFAQGAVAGWPSPMLPLLQSPASPLDGGPLTDEEASRVGSLTCVAALLAVPVFSHLATRGSRKVAGYLAAAPLLPSWLAVALGSTRTSLYLARLAAGVCCAGGTVVVPLFLAEVAHDSVRGALSTISVLFFNSGILFVYCAGSSLGYRALAWACLALAPLFAAGFALVPESPVYLVSRGRTAAAVRAVMGLQAVGPERAGEVVGRLQGRSHVEAGLLEVLSTRATLRGLAVGLGLCLNQQMSGLFAVLSYTVSIFQDAGTSLSPYTATMLVGALQILGTCLSTALVDRAGRRALLVGSNCCMAACLGCLGGYLYLARGAEVARFTWVPVAAVLGFILAVSVGPGALCFLVVSEVFSERARAAATTLCLCVLWALMFLVGRTFSAVSLLVGAHGCFWLFAACSAAGAVFAATCVPETRNRSLESILRELGGGRGELRDSGQPLREKQLVARA
ncbi:facilitated trehalose transporter Tret1-like [Bacillus rossius redtenbacheri]|uniref:facilitated trehalose transporter Tret1-like n=1 Tax=Bacillus rossius redtenbacheri TaxID=93214 RepID=UPI002FDEC55E